jgi:hypothetical protein
MTQSNRSHSFNHLGECMIGYYLVVFRQSGLFRPIGVTPPFVQELLREGNVGLDELAYHKSSTLTIYEAIALILISNHSATFLAAMLRHALFYLGLAGYLKPSCNPSFHHGTRQVHETGQILNPKVYWKVMLIN